MSYLGVPPFGQTVRTVTTQTANGSQSVFYPTGGYTVGYLDVFYNGVRVVEATDYTAGDGNSVTFAAAPTSNAVIEMISYGPISFVDSLARSGDTLGGTFYVRDLIPVANNTYSLGNSSYRFANLYLSGNTITIGDSTISANATSISFANSTGGAADVMLPNTGVVANSYGHSTAIPVVTVDAQGRVTTVTLANTVPHHDTAYSNAVSVANTTSFNQAANAYANAIATANTTSYNQAANAYANAVSTANTTSYNQAANAYANVFNGGTFTGAVTLQANLTANTVRLNGSMQIDGDLIVTGNTVTMNVSSLAVEDNMIYLNASSNVANPDIGIAGNYNDGTYRHTGVFRDATDGVWKFFHQYVPEPDASAYIDTANNTFALANVQGNFFIGSITGAANSASYLGGNTASTLRSYSDTVAATSYSNATSYAATAAGTAYSNAVAFAANGSNISSGTVPSARLGGDPTFTDVYTSGWFRNNDSNEGLYNTSSGNHWYSTADSYWNVTSGGRTSGGIRMRDSHQGTIKGYGMYWDGNGSGILGASGNWTININSGNDNYVTIGGSQGDNAYNSYSGGRRLMFGGGNSDAQGNYYIGTNMQDVGGNYNKLDLAWHTGIRAGAQSGYGGIRFFDSEDMGTVQWQFNGSSGYTYKYNWMYINTNGFYSDTNGAHFFPNTGSTYTQWQMAGNKNSYDGVYLQYSAVNGMMYDGAGNGGVYREANGRWYFYHHVGNACTGIGGSTTASGYAIRPNGNQYTDGYIYASAYYYTSDARKKENITTIPNALEKILQLRGVNFNWKDNAKVVAGRRSGGLIAQEVLPIIPEAIFEDVNDTDVENALGLDTTPIIGYLIEAIKELKKEIDELKGAK